MNDKKKIIDMEKRNGIFVPANSSRVLNRPSTERQLRRKGSTTRPLKKSQPQQIGKILEGMVTDFFKVMRREMFR